MSSETGEIFGNALTPAFMEVLENPNHQLYSELTPSVALIRLRQEITNSIRRISWSTSGIRMAYDPIAEAMPDPREVAETFGVGAVSDTEFICALSEAQAVNNGIKELSDLGKILINSRHTLPTVSTLRRDDKAKLFNEISRGLSSNHRSLVPIEPLQLELDKWGRNRFVWNPIIAEWISEHTTEGTGCPANHIIIEDIGGHKHTLMEYFWVKAIELTYLNKNSIELENQPENIGISV